jgi:hypothetical protein
MRWYAGLRISFSPGRLPPVRFSGRAVIAGRRIITECRGGGITCVSRGADCAVCDGKPKNRAGDLHPAVAVWRRGRQDAALNGKKRKHGHLRFFLPPGPRLRPGAVPPPLSRGRTGLRPERNAVKRREQTPPICLLRGGSPAARGRDNRCHRCTAA